MMNSGTGYSQANMRGHMTLMPGSSPTYHPKASPGQDPYGYGGLPPTAASMTFPSPTAARSFTESGANMFGTMGQQPGLTPTGSQAFFASHGQDNSASMYAPQQQRFGEVNGQVSQGYNPPLRDTPARAGKAECQEECAEEECVDSEQCGNEQKPPKPEQLCCGVDTRPFLPIALTLSTVCGLICVMIVQVPMLARLCNVSEGILYCGTLSLYVITLYALAYSALMDPGQLQKDYAPPPGAALISTNNENSTDADEEAPDRNLPKRAHKCWQYKRPVRRYDHYCRWLTNVIGLLNHREFFVMVCGLVCIGTFGVCLDVVLMIAMERKGNLWGSSIFVILHLLYSIALTGLAGPILKIHIGLVSRNEVAHEWKKNCHYIVKKCRQGENVNVNALSDDEFNALFDSFVYDSSKNPFDKGCFRNCWSFWCTWRSGEDQLGEF
jgi:hypothetical protein